jgi:hypothetical protein
MEIMGAMYRSTNCRAVWLVAKNSLAKLNESTALFQMTEKVCESRPLLLLLLHTHTYLFDSCPNQCLHHSTNAKLRVGPPRLEHWVIPTDTAMAPVSLLLSSPELELLLLLLVVRHFPSWCRFASRKDQCAQRRRRDEKKKRDTKRCDFQTTVTRTVEFSTINFRDRSGWIFVSAPDGQTGGHWSFTECGTRQQINEYSRHE